jgi:hypothetical protein
VCTGGRKCIRSKRYGITRYTTPRGRRSRPPSRFGYKSPGETGEEQSRKEFVPGEISEEESGSEEELGEPQRSNQENQIRHIKELIADVEQQIQFAQEEQEVVEQGDNEHRLHNSAEYGALLEWLDETKDLLKRLLFFTEFFRKSIRKWKAEVTRKNEV